MIASKKSKEQSKEIKGIKDVKGNSKFDDKEIFIYKAKKEKNMEKLHFGNIKPLKNRIKNPTGKYNEPNNNTEKSSFANNSSSKNTISNDASKNIIIKAGYLKNSTVKISIIKKSKMKNTTKQKSKMKGNPMKKRSIKNIPLKNKINPKTIINEKSKIGIKEDFNNFIDAEINTLNYNIAVKFDKRSYCQYYGSLLKTQHLLICALFNNNDYNSGMLKMDLYF